jgi:hypothetical protein
VSRRARRARVLAGVLSRLSGVAVAAFYERDRNGYRIAWTGGPDEQRMRTIAASVAEDFGEFDLDAMSWHRVTRHA